MKIVLESIKDKLDRENISFRSDQFLLGVSGGVDSMVLLDAFHSFTKNIQVAHINYNLRGEFAKSDENVVASYCEEKNIPFHLKSVDLKSILNAHGGNLQNIARQIRMQFFDTVLNSTQLKYIVLAHHHDDQIENILLHSFRGYGPKAMQFRSGNILRPFLSISKSELLAYAKEKNLQFNTDQSNATNTYDRNFLRNEIIPELRKRFDFFDQKLIGFSDRYNEDLSLIQHLAKAFVKDSKIEKSDIFSSRMLYHLIKNYGFSHYQSKEIFKDLNKTGIIIESESHRILIDRHFVILDKLDSTRFSDITISSPSVKSIKLNEKMELIISKLGETSHETRRDVILNIPPEKYPLRIRTWKEGDRFTPKGMKGKSKKLKKLFQDHKLDRFTKHKTPILVDKDDNIIWVLGLQVDSKYSSIKEDKSAMLFSLI